MRGTPAHTIEGEAGRGRDVAAEAGIESVKIVAGHERRDHEVEPGAPAIAEAGARDGQGGVAKGDIAERFRWLTGDFANDIIGSTDGESALAMVANVMAESTELEGADAFQPGRLEEQEERHLDTTNAMAEDIAEDGSHVVGGKQGGASGAVGASREGGWIDEHAGGNASNVFIGGGSVAAIGSERGENAEMSGKGDEPEVVVGKEAGVEDGVLRAGNRSEKLIGKPVLARGERGVIGT